ncbi:hypothetical protein [Leifsonia aquatica]|uniref:hypothetical protein n=1 Tax=Leifsonia aquatica TaxID=144185 RepID=UPI0037F7C17E
MLDQRNRQTSRMLRHPQEYHHTASRSLSGPSRRRANPFSPELNMLLAAIVLVVIADAYFVITTLVDLHPLNNVTQATPRERRSEVLINAPIMLLPAILLTLAGATGYAWLALIGASGELLIALSGLILWWLPYLAGITVPWATAGTDSSWAELHARTYEHTVIILPRIGDRPRPNLEHMILHVLLITAAVFGFIAAAHA